MVFSTGVPIIVMLLGTTVLAEHKAAIYPSLSTLSKAEGVGPPLIRDRDAGDGEATISLWKLVMLALLGFFSSAVMVIAICRFAASRNCEACKNPSSQVDDSNAYAPLLSSVLVAVASFPALMGMCCWPLLVAGLLSMAQLSNDTSRSVAHSLTWGANLGAIVSLLPDLLVRTDRNRGHLSTFWRWAPVLLFLLAGLFVMEDPTRHLLVDLGMYTRRLGMYKGDGGLTMAGEIGIACTWIGVVLLWAPTYQASSAM